MIRREGGSVVKLALPPLPGLPGRGGSEPGRDEDTEARRQQLATAA